ncbi:MAG: TIGR00282 family metallophosphoesterase [Thermodesulfobacteriota bacterium]|nr:MAG: TIGR00282 family metallophosphoesterase [Thermodesulfobacteriota bacterium]
MAGHETKILFIGDIIGRPGRRAIRELLPGLIYEYSPDVVIANGENAAGGFGITLEIYEELKKLNIDVITSGNHIWDRKEILGLLGKSGEDLLRPGNYPPGVPGSGGTVFKCPSGVGVGIINLSGRVFMDKIDCPFRIGRALIDRIRKETPVIIVDMHAETTSEKAAVGWYFNGLVSAVIGTHTHVQTSDERILSGGTAFITDAGMTGPTDSIIGMRKEKIIERFLTELPVRFEVATGGIEIQGVFVSVNSTDGKATRIERIKRGLKKS